MVDAGCGDEARWWLVCEIPISQTEEDHTPRMTPLKRFPSNNTRSTCAASKQRAHPLTLPD